MLTNERKTPQAYAARPDTPRDAKGRVMTMALPIKPAELSEARTWLDGMLKRARATGIVAEVCDITPARATIMLGNNPDNRILSQRPVQDWADALRRGDWELNGETVIVAMTGELNDGQHRLQAVVVTGIPMQSLVVFGVSRLSRTSLDGGRKRTAGMVLHMRGAKNANNMATAIRIIMNIEAGISPESLRGALEIEAAFDAHPGLEKSYSWGDRLYMQFRQSKGAWAALHYLFSKVSPDQANQFFGYLIDGVTPSVDHPCALWRRRFTRILSTPGKRSMTESLAVTIKAWNIYRVGGTAKNLRWGDHSSGPEPFPVIK